MKSKDPSHPQKLILFRAKCLPSLRTKDKNTDLMYRLHAVFDLETGTLLHCPYSTCSCTDGDLFCSHLASLILLIGTAKIKVQANPELTQEAFLNPISSRHDHRKWQNKAVIVENYTLKDIKNRKRAQQTVALKKQMEKRISEKRMDVSLCSPCTHRPRKRCRFVSP